MDTQQQQFGQVNVGKFINISRQACISGDSYNFGT